MAQPISLLSTLTAQSEFKTILVRVTRMWQAINKRTNQLMYTNIVLLDEQDNHILAIVRTNQKEAFLDKLNEQDVYTISNFKVVPGPTSYRTVDRDLTINFYYRTRIQQVSDTGTVPRYKFELKEFSDIQSYIGSVKCFIDVVGMVTAYGLMETRTNGARKMDVVITNKRSERMVVTLWEARATEFQDAVMAASGEAIFVVLTGLMAKKFSGFGPVLDLREAMLTATGKSLATLPRPVPKPFVNAEDIDIPDLNIQGILEAVLPVGSNLIRRTCEATIVAVMASQGWYYNCCPLCARKVRPMEETFYCDSCVKETPDFKPRYKLIVRVKDHSGETTFTLFNKEAESLIGVPVDSVISNMAEDQDANTTPFIINSVVGKRCIFDIKINTYNTERGYEEYTVSRVSQCEAEPPQEEDTTNNDVPPSKKLKTA